jgi:uncharacterized protein
VLVVDAGPLVAAAARRDRNHLRCARLLTESREPLVVPSLVVTEVAHFLGARLGGTAERAFAESLGAGELEVEPVDVVDWSRIVELLETYAELEIGIVDASVVATCERLGVTRLATLDHRHFAAIRPAHCPAFEIVPA